MITKIMLDFALTRCCVSLVSI